MIGHQKKVVGSCTLGHNTAYCNTKILCEYKKIIDFLKILVITVSMVFI